MHATQTIGQVKYKFFQHKFYSQYMESSTQLKKTKQKNFQAFMCLIKQLSVLGGFVPGQGGPTPAGRSVVFMITNLCPNVYPNQHWCNQGSQYGGHNDYGYEVHFDLENGANQIRGSLGWNNAEVTWEPANCDEGHRHDGRTPSYAQWGGCQCAHQGRRSVNGTLIDPPMMPYNGTHF